MSQWKNAELLCEELALEKDYVSINRFMFLAQKYGLEVTWRTLGIPSVCSNTIEIGNEVVGCYYLEIAGVGSTSVYGVVKASNGQSTAECVVATEADAFPKALERLGFVSQHSQIELGERSLIVTNAVVETPSSPKEAGPQEPKYTPDPPQVSLQEAVKEPAIRDEDIQKMVELKRKAGFKDNSGVNNLVTMWGEQNGNPARTGTDLNAENIAGFLRFFESWVENSQAEVPF